MLVDDASCAEEAVAWMVWMSGREYLPSSRSSQKALALVYYQDGCQQAI